MMLIYETATFASVWTNILKIRAFFVNQTLTEHALSWNSNQNKVCNRPKLPQRIPIPIINFIHPQIRKLFKMFLFALVRVPIGTYVTNP